MGSNAGLLRRALVQWYLGHTLLASTHLFGKCDTDGGMQTAVGHRDADTCVQLAHVLKRNEALRKADKVRKAAAMSAGAGAPKLPGAKSGASAAPLPAASPAERPAAKCMQHVASLQQEATDDIANAHIDMDGTPTEKVWAAASAARDRRERLRRTLAAVYPGQMEPLCQHLASLQRKVRASRRRPPVCGAHDSLSRAAA